MRAYRRRASSGIVLLIVVVWHNSTTVADSDVVLGLGPLVVLKDKVSVLFLAKALRLQSLLTLHILRPPFHWCRRLSAYDAACSLKHFSYAFTYLVH